MTTEPLRLANILENNITNAYKMKRIISIVMLFAALSTGAQILNVKSIEPLRLPADISTTQVVAISHDGSFALLTDATYNGLTRYDFASGQTSVVSYAVGAGLAPAISLDDSHVAFREVSFSETHRRLTAVKVANFATRATSYVVPPSREVQGVAFTGQTATAIVAGQPARRAIAEIDSRRVRAAQAEPVLSINNEQLMITRDGVTTLLSPCGTEGCSYIWPSVSPSGRRIMFYLVGSGIYTCNLNGSDLKFVADLHAPVWYTDDVIIAMNDIDGIDTQVSSEIVAIRLNNGEKQVLCGGDDFIAMYPQACAKVGRIAFTTRDGAPYLISLTNE